MPLPDFKSLPNQPLMKLPRRHFLGINGNILMLEVFSVEEMQSKIPQEPGFLLNFDEKGSPRPRYLGRVDAVTCVEKMQSKIPPLGFKADGETEVIEDRSCEHYGVKSGKRLCSLQGQHGSRDPGWKEQDQDSK